MLRRGILLLSLVMVTLGSPRLTMDEDTQWDSQTPEADETEGSLLLSGDSCIFDGDTFRPSFLCYVRCGRQLLRPDCEEYQGICVCVSLKDEVGQEGDTQEEPITPEPTVLEPYDNAANETDNSKQDKLHMFFYIFDLSSLFGSTNGTNITDVVNVTNILATDMPVEDLMEEETMKGWASSHILAIIIVALLSVLVIVELAACFKKQKGKQREANLFTSNLGMPNKS